MSSRRILGSALSDYARPIHRIRRSEPVRVRLPNGGTVCSRLVEFQHPRFSTICGRFLREITVIVILGNCSTVDYEALGNTFSCRLQSVIDVARLSGNPSCPGAGLDASQVSSEE